jgi:membrane associated rhomboid family serine protease
MFPIGDDNSARRIVPYVTYGLIALNVVFFFIELTSGDAFINSWAFVPSRFIANPAGDFLTLFTSMFMHVGWLHLGGNMLYLWIFGDNVEDSDIPNLGASGAIAGVLGAYIILFPKGRIRVLQGQSVIQVSALIVIGLWIVIQLFSGIGSITSTEQGGVAYLAHIGGFVAGILLTFVFRGRQPALPRG